MKTKSLVSSGTLATVLALIGTVALAVDTTAIDQQVSTTLDKFYALSKDNKSLAQKAAAVLVFPDITKGGIGIGGEHGDGALQQGGKTVGYYSISGASMKNGAGGKYDTQSLSKPVNVFVFGEKGLMGDASLGGAKISKIKQ